MSGYYLQHRFHFYSSRFSLGKLPENDAIWFIHLQIALKVFLFPEFYGARKEKAEWLDF